MSNYVSYANATALMNGIATKFNSLGAAYKFRGNSTFANLPSTLTQAMAGYTYNVTDEFTTDARFVEGAGKKYPAGTNVAVADLTTYEAVASPSGDPSALGYYELVNGKYVLSADTTVTSGKTYYTATVSVKLDIAGSFVDVDGINARIDAAVANLADAFDSTKAYVIGDVVVYEDGLYQFKAAHTENTDWDDDEVDPVTLESLIAAAEPDSLTSAQVNALLALLD